MIDTVELRRKRIRRAIRRLVRAEIANSWSGSLPVNEWAEIKKELKLARKNSNRLLELIK